MASTRASALRLLLVLGSVLLSGCYLHRDPNLLNLTMAVSELPETLDPHLNDRPYTRYVNAALFDALTVINERGELQPGLATSWKPLGPTTWEFKLRQGVRFHNGEEFNANTVAFNVRRVLRREFHSPVLQDVPTLFRANPRDLYTVVIATRKTDPILPRRLAALYMVPTDYTQRAGDELFAQEPIGTGPWRVASFVPNDHLRLEAQKGAWRAVPQSRNIEVRRVPDPDARAQALADGLVQVALDVPVDQHAALSERGFQLREAPVSAARLLMLDTYADDVPFSNIKVRQALNYAIDKEGLIDRVVGAGIPLAGQVVGAEANGYSERVQLTYPYNPAEAQRLMNEAGFPNGFQLRIYYTNTPDEQERRELAAITNDLARINVSVSLRPNERAAHVQRRISGSLTPAYYDTFPYWVTEDASAVLDFFEQDRTETLAPTYDFDDFEEIYKLSRSEQEPALRRQALAIGMQLLSEAPGAIYLYQPVRIHALQKGVADFKAFPNLLFDLDRVGR